MTQRESVTIERNRCPRQLREFMNCFLFVFYGLWNKLVRFFSKPTRAVLELENNALRVKMESQKQVFREIVHGHEVLLLRIFTIGAEHDSLRRENERIIGSATALEKEIGIVKKAASEEKKQADAFVRSKKAEVCEMNEKHKLLETEIADLKNASCELQTERDGLEKKCTSLEADKQKLGATISAMDKKREQETSKWLSLAEGKAMENKAMDSEISLLKKANDQMKVERERMREVFEALKDSMADVKKASNQYLFEKEAHKETCAQFEREKRKFEAKLVDQGRKLNAEFFKRSQKLARMKQDITAKDKALFEAKRASSASKSEKEALKDALEKLKQEKSDLEGRLFGLKL